MHQVIQTTLKRDVNGNKYITATFGKSVRIRRSFELSKCELQNHCDVARELSQKVFKNWAHGSELCCNILNEKSYVFTPNQDQYVVVL